MVELELCSEMAKRFTDTDKFRSDFYLSLKAPYKLLWEYLQCTCNHAGIWLKDFEAARKYVGKDVRITEKDAFSYFNKDKDRVVPVGENHWYLTEFIDEQYGKLNPANRVHASVIAILDNFGLWRDGSIIYNKEEVEKPVGYETYDFSFMKLAYREPFFDWLTYKRKEKSQKYKTQKTLMDCYNELERLSMGDPMRARAIVNKCKSNLYTGLFGISDREYGEQQGSASRRELNREASLEAIRILRARNY